jgi:LmbE family N-acetylglucosaminyl deacetylase
VIVKDYLDLTRKLPLGTLSELTEDAPFVVLSPHPDDETLGAGGLIKQACAKGQHVEVIVLTDGAGSHTQSIEYPPSRLIQVRRQEVAQAASILGLPTDHLHHLDLPDAHMPCAGRVFEKTVQFVRSLVERIGAKTLFVTWHHDPHCDHKAAAEVARATKRLIPALQVWAYPIWGWHLDPLEDLESAPQGVRLDIAQEADAKRRAIAAHRSQMTNLIHDNPDGFRFNANTLAPFLTSFEVFYAA